MNISEIDYKKLTWRELAQLVLEVWRETKRRNPIGVNAYAPSIFKAAELLVEITNAEEHHQTGVK